MTVVFDVEGYDMPLKDAAWRGFLKSYDINNRGDLDINEVQIKTARTRFERWWAQNYE